MFRKKKTNETNNGPVVCSTSSTSTTTTTYRTANGGTATATRTTTYRQQIITSSAVRSSGRITSSNSPSISSSSFQAIQDKPRISLLDDSRLLTKDTRPIVPLGKTSSLDDWKSKIDARPYESKLQTRSAFGGQPLHNYNTKSTTANLVQPTKNLITYNPPKTIPKTAPPIATNTPTHKGIKVKKTFKFHDDPSAKVPTYSTRSKNRGSLLIINNVEFAGKRREGAEIDEANMKELFKQMGFSVKSHKNKKKHELEKVIRNHTSDSSLRKVDISMTIIMSHGNRIGEETHIETIDGHTVPTEWVVQQFASANCKYLEGKPKIFIFQCCRGEGEDIIQTDAKVFQRPRAQEDILIAYATVPGFVSYRYTSTGSWYINRIRDVFMEHAHDTHIEDLLKIVDDELAKENDKFKQTSSYESRGFKKCYLNPI